MGAAHSAGCPGRTAADQPDINKIRPDSSAERLREAERGRTAFILSGFPGKCHLLLPPRRAPKAASAVSGMSACVSSVYKTGELGSQTWTLTCR